jgi:hypothetical protein
MNNYYKLDENKNAIPCSCREWADQLEQMSKDNNKHIADETIDGKRISTVWLGLNHNINDRTPHIFETMVFNGDDYGHDIYCDRYSTYQEAEEGHKKAVQWVKDGCKEDE